MPICAYAVLHRKVCADPAGARVEDTDEDLESCYGIAEFKPEGHVGKRTSITGAKQCPDAPEGSERPDIISIR